MGNLAPIASFPDDNRIWRIECLRAIEQNDLVPSEPLTQVVIVPLVSDIQKKTSQIHRLVTNKRSTMALSIQVNTKK